MKKAILFAVGALQAFCGMAEVVVSEGFEGTDVKWVGRDSKVKEFEAGDGDWGRRRPDEFQGGGNGKYLEMCATNRTDWSDASLGEDFYLDTMMRFETGETNAPAAAVTDGAKFGVWMEAGEDGCFLKTYGGRFTVDGGEVSVVPASTGATMRASRFHKGLSDGAWHRVTVRRKAVTAGGRTFAGFELWVDGLLFTLSEPPCGEGTLEAIRGMAGCEELAEELAGCAFIPSAAEGEVTQVGFSGYGGVDDVAGVKGAAPGFLPGGGKAAAVNGVAFGADETEAMLAEVKSGLEGGNATEVRMLAEGAVVNWEGYGEDGMVKVEGKELIVRGERAMQTNLLATVTGSVASVTVEGMMIAGNSKIEAKDGATVVLKNCDIGVTLASGEFVSANGEGGSVTAVSNRFAAAGMAAGTVNFVRAGSGVEVTAEGNNNGWMEMEGDAGTGYTLKPEMPMMPGSGSGGQYPSGVTSVKEIAEFNARVISVTPMPEGDAEQKQAQKALVNTAIGKAGSGAAMSEDEEAVVNKILLNDEAAGSEEKIKLEYTVGEDGKWNFTMTREDGTQLVKGADTVQYGYLRIESAESLAGPWTEEMRVTCPEGANATDAAPQEAGKFYRARFYWNAPAGGAQE